MILNILILTTGTTYPKQHGDGSFNPGTSGGIQEVHGPHLQHIKA